MQRAQLNLDAMKALLTQVSGSVPDNQVKVAGEVLGSLDEHNTAGVLVSFRGEILRLNISDATPEEREPFGNRSGIPWQPEETLGHKPFCAHPYHSLAYHCAADPDEPDTLEGNPSRAWRKDHPYDD